MRTNIEIDDELLAEAMKAGPYTSKKETVDAGLRLLARQVAYREVLKWRGKLHFDADEGAHPTARHPIAVAERPASYAAVPSKKSPTKRRARR